MKTIEELTKEFTEELESLRQEQIQALGQRGAEEKTKELFQQEEALLGQIWPLIPNTQQIEINGLLWDTTNLTNGDWKRNDVDYFTHEKATEAALGVGKRLPTHEEYEALFDMGSTWDKTLRGVWVAGNHDSDHAGSLFFPAAGYGCLISSFLSPCSVGDSGTYWSASFYSDACPYYLGFSFGEVYLSEYAYYYHGFTVRCVRDKMCLRE